jgi:ribonucleoside-diphosphate reductase beta chain
MMLLSFAAREAVHIDAYSNLIDTLGMPESTYKEFTEYEEMKAKHDYVEQFIGDSPDTIAQQISIFSAFTEGMQLFSSFIMLLNFTRHNKMNGMGQNIAYSILDEQKHVEGMTWLFKTFIKEHSDIWTDTLKSELYSIAENMVALEDKFIDLCYVDGELENLSKEEVKKYIRYISDRRLIGLGLKGIFKVKKNPLPWVEEIVNAPEHADFFATKPTAYAKAATTGSWSDIWKI